MKHRKITITTPYINVQVTALVEGSWAAHEDGFGRWHVTHVPSGCALTKQATRAGAIAAVAYLAGAGIGRSLPSELISARDPEHMEWLHGALISEVDMFGMMAANDIVARAAK